MAALVTRREAANLGGISETTVKKAVDQNVVPARKRGSKSLIEVEDVPVLTMFGLLVEMKVPLPRESKRQLRLWLRSLDRTDELELATFLVVRKVDAVDAARERAERYVRLRDAWIDSGPAAKGGDPVIRGTRVSVHTLAERIAAGESTAVLDEDFPHIPREAREVAVQYAQANPRRGRPRNEPLAA